MAHTNAWDEATPAGTEDASTADDYLKKHRVDLGERLENMLYGFNAASNAAPENDYGVKSLKFYKQTSDPTAATDYGHFYVKLVGGIPELFYQDDTNTTLQLTSGGNLKSTANLVVDGTSTLTGNVAAAGTLGVTGIATVGDASLLKTSAAPTTDAMIANKKYVDDQNTADHPAYAGGESHTDGSGMIIKQGNTGSVAADTDETVTFAAAFPTAIVRSFVTILQDATGDKYCHVRTESTTELLIRNESGLAATINWWAMGY